MPGGMFAGGRGGRNSRGSSEGGSQKSSDRTGRKQGRGWHTSSNQEAETTKKGNRKGWFSFWKGSDAASDRSAKFKGASQAADWPREAVLRSVDPKAPAIVRIRTKIPWRPSSGKSNMIHPLRQDDFCKNFFGKRAFVLRRGPAHRVMFQPSQAAALLRGATLGQDADVMGPHMWNPQTGRRPPYAAEHGMPAVAALARGKPVRLRHIERRRKSLLYRDPLVPALARLAPGRGVAGSLHWTPPHGRTVWENEAQYEQIIVQIYGVRKWTLCTRGLPPPALPKAGPRGPRSGPPRGGNRGRRYSPDDREAENAPRPPKRDGKCVSAILRRGDVLYVPSRTWHWTGDGPKASSHLELGLVPLTASDLVMGLGGRNILSDPGHPALASLLPLWRYSRAEDATETVLPICFDLPWADAPLDASAICTPVTVRMALQRLSGASGRTNPHWHASSGPVPAPQMRPWPRARPTGFFSPVMEALQPVAQMLGIIGLLVLVLCLCGAANSGKTEKRQMRTARAIHTDRQMMRRSRINLQQQTGRHKKID